MNCRICGAAGPHADYVIPEMMLGLGEFHDYFECQECGCLQIKNMPGDMSRYYPEKYYSYHLKKGGIRGYKGKVKALKAYLSIPCRLGSNRFFAELIRPPLRTLAQSRIGTDSHILDVGCGNGELLNLMASVGFNHLTGVDPFIQDNICYDNGVRILKNDFWGMDGLFDVIMFHHSFEHIFEQDQTLQHVYQKLKPGGLCIIRIPTVSSFAWRHYKECWVQIDAPRHFFLHSLDSMKLLSSRHGFLTESIIYDSTAFQFWGSELYLKGVPLSMIDKDGGRYPKKNFSKKEMSGFIKKTARLNRSNDGDQVSFLLRKH